MPANQEALRLARFCSRQTIMSVRELLMFSHATGSNFSVGYNEKDPIRGQDSINTFREILALAVENDVS